MNGQHDFVELQMASAELTRRFWVIQVQCAAFEPLIARKGLLILLIGLALICPTKATVIADVIIEGLPVKVLSAGKSYKVFEQYPWEGHSSKYGPKGNRLNPGKGVGVGKNVARSLQLRQGDWIHMPTSVGDKSMNLPAKKMGSNFLLPIGMNTRANIPE